MNLEEVFTSEEISELLIAPARVFNLIGKADEKIDKKESKAYENFILNYKKLDSELARDLFLKISSPDELITKRSNSSMDDRASLRYLSALLDRKLDRDSAVDYKITLVSLGYYVAYSSGGFFEEKVNDDETESLILLCKDLDLTLRELLNSNQIQKLLNRVIEN
ncbi:hypothetical protein MASR1M45_03420 [Candidatus Kapaibacterium sp.]